ncbi:hypothetical protein SISSUDRAFT_1039776 [Sistotremastrum suecicum HHB10207 ss-3]|uniref:Transcription termination and cleavage factor C-terminal domain-containing protein n=1 Tax=Sistotremastrum suecicum HHB10207 ss-3 TaxID=1314776 RepID=A0A166ILJ5_9AGAM|nr:hypothetical protein SISSUDRAFT_1039776 [Sistotremastrum suecicum HHB10207 ss-3]
MQQILQPPRASVASRLAAPASTWQQPYAGPPATAPVASFPQSAQAQFVTQNAPPNVIASIPEDQRALLMRVIAMTPSQIEQLPPTERATFIQLRQTLGLPT